MDVDWLKAKKDILSDLGDSAERTPPAQKEKSLIKRN